MIPIGVTVDITTPPGALKPNRWRGVVTGRPGPYSIEIDGRLTAPANLAKVVGMTEAQEDALNDKIEALMDERDGLAELVAMQCEMIAAVPNDKEVARLQEVEADFIRLRDAVGQHFFNVFGTHTPTSLDCRAAGVDASDLIAEIAGYA